MILMNDFCKKTYGSKLYKLSFNGGFTCPNRDGTKGNRGCIFCSEGGSGDFAVNLTDAFEKNGELNLDKLDLVIKEAKEKVAGKYKGDKFIAYFQAFTGTYASVEYLRKIYFPIVERDDISVLSIATRPDCLTDEIYELLKELNQIKPLWIELGLQTTKEKSISYIRRGYSTDVYDEAVLRLKSLNIHVITHMILYLPGETKEDMRNTLRHIVYSGSDGVKLQLLHILKGTDLEKDYMAFLESSSEIEFEIPTLDEYAETIKELVDIMPENMVLHRMTGDAPKKLLVEPKWSADKKRVLNTVNEKLNPTGPYFVYIIRCEDGSLYTGSTNDVEKRFLAHVKGTGAKYTKSHIPVELVYVETLSTKNEALSREWHIKHLPRKDKIELIRNYNA